MVLCSVFNEKTHIGISAENTLKTLLSSIKLFGRLSVDYVLSQQSSLSYANSKEYIKNESYKNHGYKFEEKQCSRLF